MKTLLRSVVWLALVVWLGGLFFFVVTAGVTFSHLSDTHAAGTIVGASLRILHHEGLVAGCVMVLLLAIGSAVHAYRSSVIVPIVVTVIMLGLTAFSQYWIIPHMEAYRIAAGGAIDNTPPSDPRHAGFNRLHHTSENVETAIMVGGLVLVVLLSRESCA